MATTPRGLRRLLLFFIAGLPLVMSLLLTNLLLNASLKDYVPATLCQRYNDATDYWLQTKAFAATGFNSGYFGREEDVSRCPGIRFGWQNFISYAYGLPAYVLGWQLWSPAVWNPVLIGACLFLFLWTADADYKRLVLAGLLIITFWPLLFFLPTMMAEPFHYCLAVIAATGFAQTLGSGGKARKSWAWFTTALLFLAGVARPSWLPLLFLSVFIAVEKTDWRGYLFTFLAGILFCAVSYGLFSLMMPDTTTYSASGAIMSGHFHLSTVTANLYQNLALLKKDNLFLTAFRLQTALLLMISVSDFILALWRRPHQLRVKTVSLSSPDGLIHAFNLTSIVFLTLTVYLTANWADYRILSIYVLFSALLAIARWKITAIPIFLIISGLFLAPMFIKEYRVFRGYEFTYDKSRLSKFYSQISPHIRYNPKADPWDNTLLYGGKDNIYPTELVALPAGFGLRIIVVPQNLRFPIHSRYVLLDNQYYYDWLKKKERLFPLARTCIGNLYYCLHENEPAVASNGLLKGNLGNPDLTCWLGDIYLSWGKTDDAIRYFQKALEHSPGMFRATCNLALCYSRQGKDEQALSLFQRAIENNPEFPEPYYNIACIYARANRLEDAIGWLKKSIEKGYHNWELLRRDRDLDMIRQTDFYKQLMNNVNNAGHP